jgi:carboxylate-amine ligase
MAALSQCLVHQFDSMIDRGYTLPTPRAWLVRENKWRAARHGLDASIIVDEGGTTVPLRQAIRELVEDLTPVAARLGCSDELRGAIDIMARGSSYIRQREIVAAGGSLADVVDSLIAELHADMPAPRGAVLEAVGKQAVTAGD